jgi:hypothetical protein
MLFQHRTNFSKNWNNKLLADRFLDIRIYDENKHYKNAPHYIYLNGDLLGITKIVDIERVKASEVSRKLSLIISGLEPAILMATLGKMYSGITDLKNDTILVINTHHWYTRNNIPFTNLVNNWAGIIQQDFEHISI